MGEGERGMAWERGRGQGVVKFTSAALATLLLPPSLPVFFSLRCERIFVVDIIMITFALNSI